MGQRDKERQRRGKVSRVTPYTGFPINTQQFIQPQRSAGIPMGGSSTTTGPAQFQQEQEASSPLGGLLAAKESYDQVNKAYKGGQKLSSQVKDFGSDLYRSGEDAVTGMKNIFSDTSSLTNAGADQILNSPDIGSMFGGGTANRYDLAGGVPGGVQNLDTIMDPTFQFGNAGQTGVTGLPAGISESMMPSATINGESIGLSSNAPAVPGGPNYLGAAGAGLGVGLNINDMVQNGVSFGNVTGALGSGILGASALTVGAANVWNPLGWALLGASAIDSIFDIF